MFLMFVLVAAAGCGYNSVRTAPPDDLADGGADGAVAEDSATADGSMEVDAGVEADASEPDGEECIPGPMGHLTISCVVPEEPKCNQLVMGETGVKIAQCLFEADETADINIWNLTVSFFSPGGGEFDGVIRNIRLHNESGDQIGETMVALGPDRRALFEDLFLEVLAGGSRQIAVVADINNFVGGAVSGTEFFAAIAGDCCSVYAVSQTAESCRGAVLDRDHITYVPQDDLRRAPSGPIYRVYRTRARFTIAADSPSGLSSPNSEQLVGKIRINNDPNIGNYEAEIEHLFPVIVGTVSFREPRRFCIYRDSFSASNRLACAHVELNGEMRVIESEPFPRVTVASGGHRDFFFTLDTTDAGSRRTLLLRFASEGNAVWSDGATGSIQHMCGTPAETPLISY